MESAHAEIPISNFLFLTLQNLKIGVRQSSTTPILSYLMNILNMERIRLRNVFQQS